MLVLIAAGITLLPLAIVLRWYVANWTAFSVGYSIAIVAFFMWIVGNYLYLLVDVYRYREKKGLRASIRNVAKGIGAIAVFGIAGFALHSGIRVFLSFLAVVAVGILLLGLLSIVAPKASARIRETIFNFLDLSDTHAGWIIGAWVAALIGVMLYFLLFSLGGVLCALGLKNCSAR